MNKTKNKKWLNALTNVALLLALVLVSLVSFIPKKSEAEQMVSASPKPIYEGNRNGNCVSLMINVYWGSEFVEPMLKVLEDEGVKTTFFVGGSWVMEEPKLLEKIYDAGHEIGNHGYHHKDHGKLSESANKEEIQACHKAVKSVLGIDMTLFAPPSGSWNASTMSAAMSLGQQTIMWTRDTIDWRDKNASLITSRAVKNVAGGDLVLMHPTAETLKALPEIIRQIKSKGLVVAPVSQTLGLK